MQEMMRRFSFCLSVANKCNVSKLKWVAEKMDGKMLIYNYDKLEFILAIIILYTTDTYSFSNTTGCGY